MSKNKYDIPFGKPLNEDIEIIGQKEFNKRNDKKISELNQSELQKELQKELQGYISEKKEQKEGYKITKKGKLKKERIAAIMIALYITLFSAYTFKQAKSKPVDINPSINNEEINDNDYYSNLFNERINGIISEGEKNNYSQLAQKYLYDNIRIGDFQYISFDTNRYESSESKEPNSKTSNIQLVDKVSIIDSKGTIIKTFDSTSTGMSIAQLLSKNNIELEEGYKVMLHVVNPANISSERGWIEAIPENFIEMVPEIETLSAEYGIESTKGVRR